MLKINKSSIALIVIALIGLLLTIIYWSLPVPVTLELIATKEMSSAIEKAHWSAITEKSDLDIVTKYYLDHYGVEIPYVDFSKNNLVISMGRQIKKLSYKRFSKYQLPYSWHPYVGDALFGKEFTPKHIYFYKIDKVEVMYDDITWPEVQIE